MKTYIDFDIKIPDNWNANLKRDFMEDALEYISVATPHIFLKMLSTMPKRFSKILDKADVEKLFRVSFNSHGLKEQHIILHPVIPEEYIKEMSVQENIKRKAIENNWLVKSISWTAEKLLGKEEYKNFNKDFEDKEKLLIQKSIITTWGTYLLPISLINMGKWLHDSGYNHFDIKIHNEDNKITNVSLSKWLHENPKAVDLLIPNKLNNLLEKNKVSQVKPTYKM